MDDNGPMAEVGDRYRRRADAFAAVIDGVAPGDWGRPSPCEGWTARDVVAHVVGFSGQVLRERAGVSVDVPAVEDDPAGAFRGIRAAVQRALDDADTTAEVSYYLDGSLSFDLPQHQWDLAVATGQDATLDPAEVEFLWRELSGVRQGWWDWHHRNGWYGPPVDVPEDAALQDRVLGMIGRDPRWSRPAPRPSPGSPPSG
jgi:uncharacterized protein (TIGR03086 family)